VLDTVSAGVVKKTRYGYDAMHQRVEKIDVNNSIRTAYLRDASGNIMAVYEYRQGSWSHAEQHLYGADRLGVHNKPVALAENGHNYMFLATKKYELSNHLGNVMTVVTDRRFVHSSNGFATAEVVSATDYFVFGMEMHGRTFSSSAYDYGFNGKIEDSEILSNGRWQDYGFRAYRNDLGRFVSVDPVTSQYPWFTPYQFAGNRPIDGVDLEGLEWAGKVIKAATKAALKKATKEFIEYGIKQRLKKYQSKQWAEQITKDALDAVDILESSPIELAIEFIPFGIGDGYAIGSLGYKIYKMQKRLMKLESIAHHATRLADLAWKPYSLSSKLAGKGSDKLRQIVTRGNNRGRDHLKDDDLAGAAKDIFDEPILDSSGRPFQHLGEVETSLNGINNDISDLRNVIWMSRSDLPANKRLLTGDSLKAAESYLDHLQDYSTNLKNRLNQAKQASTGSPINDGA
jgi:RHS repeat-associated protein